MIKTQPVLLFSDSEVAEQAQHVWLDSGGGAGGPGERRVPAGTLLLHPRRVTQATRRAREDREPQTAADRRRGRPAGEHHRTGPLPRPQPRCVVGVVCVVGV